MMEDLQAQLDEQTEIAELFRERYNEANTLSMNLQLGNRRLEKTVLVLREQNLRLQAELEEIKNGNNPIKPEQGSDGSDER